MENVLVNNYLNFLQLPIKEPTLNYLNQLIRSHQYKVRWENLPKIIDTKNVNTLESYLPKIETSVDRMINKGNGGTCWSLSKCFHWLLTELGFDVSYMYMDSGHLCLRVDLDQPYYVDVGYCAPLFQAYSLFESFLIQDEREVFNFSVKNEGINIVRNPGPTKNLNPSKITLDVLEPHILHSNDWKVSAPLKEILNFGYIDGVATSLTNNVVKQYFLDQKFEYQLTEEEILFWVTEKFHIDADIYNEAKAIYNEYWEKDKKPQH